MQISSYIYHYGLKANLPFRMLESAVGMLDASTRLQDYQHRKRAARQMMADSKWTGYIDPSVGFRQFAAGEIPALGEMAALAGEIYKRNTEFLEETGGIAPITHLLGQATESELAEIARLGTDPDIAAIFCDYFKSVPRFDNADIWISRPNAAAVGSQLLHLDKPDRQYTSIFLNILPVTEENGPLQLYDKRDSDVIRRDTAYEKLYYHGDGRLPDDQVSTGTLKSVTGPAGAGGIVDTSKCLHCGSRCASGERVVMILSYMHAHKPGIARFERFRDSLPQDEVRRLMVSR